MRIERLELNGFKSFSDKTVFRLNQGTTAIVGPNGCGKSNIVDAFKWVLGEQSAKSLRGKNMEDVIFAGSASKKTKGMAEVTLVLSDIVNLTPDKDGEDSKKHTNSISVTRRLYRSGESEYLMNKVPCRLKDIKNMFLDTGLELKAYSILEQGTIGDIVNSRPIDRRFLIEEVAGVMKYKVRKNEAVSKLESSKNNLQRLQDIIAEVKRQINTIDRHARKAERYKKLFEEIRDIEVKVAARDVASYKAGIADIMSSEDVLRLRDAEVSATLNSVEARTEEKKVVCVEEERALDEIRNRLYALEREVAVDEGSIALLKKDCDNLSDRYNYLMARDQDIDVERETAIGSIMKIRENSRAMSEEQAEFERMLSERNSAFSSAGDELAGLEHTLEEMRRNLFRKSEEISDTKNEINHLRLSIENIINRTEKSSRDIHSLTDNLSSLDLNAGQTETELASARKDLEEAVQGKRDLTAGLLSLKEQLTGSEQLLYSEREALAAMNSRLESLKELENSQKGSVDESINAICQVADIFETPAEYERAIEAVLGDKLGASVVENNEQIRHALDIIKAGNAKRSGFIARGVDIAGVSAESNMQALSDREGVLGHALSFLSLKDGFEHIAMSLLGDVYIVNDLNTAISLMDGLQSNIQRPYFVTLEGEVLEPSGMIFGGTDKGVLKVKRQIKDIEHDIELKRESISSAEGTVMSIKNGIVSCENDSLSLDGKISSLEKICQEMEIRISGFHDEKERLKKRHESIEMEINVDCREKENLAASLGEREQFIGSLEREKIEIEENITGLQMDISSRREAFEVLRTELTDVRLKLTSVNEKISAVARETERLESSVVDLDRKKNDMENERNSIRTSIAQKENEVVQKEETLKSKIRLAAEIQTEASKTGGILEGKKAELELMQKQQKDLSHELEGIHGELAGLEMKKMELSMKLEHIREDLSRTYSIDVENIRVDDPVTAEEEQGLPALKERIQKMGPVSLGTIEEYEELKTRFEFLTKQRDDLLSAIEALEDTISKINRTSRKRLQQAFEALNEKFKEVFATLFGKGKAELQLTDSNILEAGIEIIAQPPGKKLQNLTLLSGGEKALTALSLLFAGFMIKPTPLCLLDEVDAPLDESNTERFSNMVREMSEHIQFIAITHNRRTMEAANNIYGITMEEPGASKVVSMNLVEAG